MTHFSFSLSSQKLIQNVINLILPSFECEHKPASVIVSYFEMDLTKNEHTSRSVEEKNINENVDVILK